MKDRFSGAWMWCGCAVMAALLYFPDSSWCGKIPQKGDSLPAMQLTAPSSEADRLYLGIKGPTFKLQDVDAQVIVIEIIGVYCPHCYKQAPLFKNLFSRLEKGKYAGKVKMVGIAAGGTPEELEYLREKGQYNYPLVQDETFAVHKLLGEPKTPFTMLVDKKGKVHFAHLGIIEDIEALHDEIGKLVE